MESSLKRRLKHGISMSFVFFLATTSCAFSFLFKNDEESKGNIDNNISINVEGSDNQGITHVDSTDNVEENPDNNPDEENPGDNPGDTGGGNEPGDNPGDTGGGSEPGDNPGDTGGGNEPGDNPGDTGGDNEPGDNPGDTGGGNEPGDNPGDSGEGGEPGVVPPSDTGDDKELGEKEKAPSDEIKNKIKFEVDKKSVELDYGGERIHTGLSGSIKGTTYPCINKTETVTATYDLGDSGYTDEDVKVQYIGPYFKDSNYFDVVQKGNSAEITAKLPSRLFLLYVYLVLSRNTHVILKQETVLLRSVTVNTARIWNTNFENSKIAGCDISGYESGYAVQLFNTEYDQYTDIVIPSKVNINGEEKMVNEVERFANEKGTRETGVIGCHSIYIPNTIAHVRGFAFGLFNLHEKGKIIFGLGGTPYTFLCANALLFNGAVDDGANFYYMMEKNIKYFPFNKYGTQATLLIAQKRAPTFSSLSSLSQLSGNATGVPYILKKAE